MNHTAIITVVYKNYTVLEDFLGSLAKQKNKNFHIFIADASEKRENFSIPKGVCATIIAIDNKGYAHGVNECLKEAMKKGYENFCVINDDTEFSKNFTEILQLLFEKNKNKAFSGKIYYAKGFEYHKNRYKNTDLGHILWYAGGKMRWEHSTTSHIGVDEVDLGQYDKTSETEFITGCLFCFNKNVLNKVGFWDENYFLYYEDADYSQRIKEKNIPLIYEADLVIFHKNAQSTDGSGSQFQQSVQKNAHLRFALKYAPIKTKLHVLKNYFFRK